MITEVRNRIYSIGSNIAGLSGKFYFIEAPQGTQLPYATFNLIINTASRDSARKFEELTFQVDLFGENLVALETIEANTKNAFDEAEESFTLGSYHCDRIERELTRNDKSENVFQITMQYRLELTKL